MLTRFQHDRLGECELVRIEGVDWVVRSCENGKLYRVPPSRRHDFVPIDADRLTSFEAADPLMNSDNRQKGLSVTSDDGVKRLLRALRNGNRREKPVVRDAVKAPTPVTLKPYNADAKSESSCDVGVPFRPDTPLSPPLESADPPVNARTLVAESPRSTTSAVVEARSFASVNGLEETEKRRLRRVFESLRNGLNPINIDSRPFAVGIEVVQQKVNNLLVDISAEGGRAVVIRGAYGQGKTFCLQLLKQIALESDYVVASTEIDSNENRLDKPHCIYRSLLQQLAFPGQGRNGPNGLAERTLDVLRRRLGPNPSAQRYANSAFSLLESEIQCRPLAWLLSDPNLLQKEILLGLLSGEPIKPKSSDHVLTPIDRYWRPFMWGTQGDLSSFLLSGIGRLTRFLGYRGLVVILDEMEKWKNLDWNAQVKAGNFLGGLIWASSAVEGHRSCRRCPGDMRWYADCDHTAKLEHSRVYGGFPFTTVKPCSLGLAIAMTPRYGDSPEDTWSEYGDLEIVDLPSFTTEQLKTYVQKIFPDYCIAYDLAMSLPNTLPAAAMESWRFNGDGSTRTAIQAVMATLDGWRQSLISIEV